MFRTVPLSIIKCFSLYTQQWYMLYTACKQDQNGTQLASDPFHPDPACKLSAYLYDIYRCCVHGEKLLMMDRGTVQNM